MYIVPATVSRIQMGAKASQSEGQTKMIPEVDPEEDK